MVQCLTSLKCSSLQVQTQVFFKLSSFLLWSKFRRSHSLLVRRLCLDFLLSIDRGPHRVVASPCAALDRLENGFRT